MRVCPCKAALFCRVLFRGKSELCLKTFRKIRVIGKAYHIHYLCHCKLFLLQQHGCFFMRMDLIYSTGVIPVSCFSLRYICLLLVAAQSQRVFTFNSESEICSSIKRVTFARNFSSYETASIAFGVASTSIRALAS